MTQESIENSRNFPKTEKYAHTQAMKKERSILLTQTRSPSNKETEFWKNEGYTTIYHQSLLNVELLPAQSLNVVPQAIVLTSSNAALALQHSDWDRTIVVYTVGNATASKAKTMGFTKSSSPSDAAYPSAVNLIEWIKKNLQPNNGPIVFGCGNHLRHDVAKILNEYGFETIKILLYTTQIITIFDQKIESALKNKSINALAVNSEMALSGFVNLCNEMAINIKQLQIFAPSKFLKECARKAGFSNVSTINYQQIHQ